MEKSNYYKLLVNTLNVDSDFDLICEQQNVDAPKTYRIKGPYILFGKENANGRIYDETVIDKAVVEYKKTMIDTKRSLGELEHSQTAQITLENCCHVIESLTKQGTHYVGTSKVLDQLPKGKILLGLLQSGIRTAISTRGIGRLNEKNVVDDYKLITCDIVHDPSSQLSFLDFIVESKNFILKGLDREIVEVAYDQLESKISKLPTHIDEKKKLIAEAVKQFLKQI